MKEVIIIVANIIMMYLTWLYYKNVVKVAQDEKNERKKQKNFYSNIKSH